MAEFTRDPVNAGDHRTYRRAGSPPGSVIEMPIVRIDELAIDAEVDFVLIDTQSFDHRVVCGMEGLVSRSRPTMMVEYWVEGLTELGDDPARVVTHYRSLGYEASVLDFPDFDPGSTPEEFVAVADAANGHYVSLVLRALSPGRPVPLSWKRGRSRLVRSRGPLGLGPWVHASTLISPAGSSRAGSVRSAWL